MSILICDRQQQSYLSLLREFRVMKLEGPVFYMGLFNVRV